MDIGSNGKTQVVKHGTKEITREGFEYELTINFELVNENHLAKASKDRTGLFMGKPEFVISENTGKEILDWCNAGAKVQEDKIDEDIEQKHNEKQGNLSPETPQNSARFQKPNPTSRNGNLPQINPKEAFESPKSEESFAPSQDLSETTEKEVFEAIGKCNTVQELYALYKQFPQFQVSLMVDFEAKKSLLINLTNPKNFSQNGKSKIQ